MAGISAADLDMIIVGTISGDTPMPACAVHVQQKLGAGNVPELRHLRGLRGLPLWDLHRRPVHPRNGPGEYVLVIGVELLSRVLNWKDRTTCVLFGDGAGGGGAGARARRRGPRRRRGILSTRSTPTARWPRRWSSPGAAPASR
jgi:3-oxoacyl-[acyl-carrier-protein] synthase-3